MHCLLNKTMNFKTFLEAAENEIIVYHGSPNKITNFSTEFVGGKEAHDQEGPGVYFTSSPDDAKIYGGFVHKVKLTPRKLVPLSGKINKSQIEKLILSSVGLNNVKELKNMDMNRFWESSLSNFGDSPDESFHAAVKSIMDYSNSPHDAFQNVWINHFRYRPKDYVSEMVRLGYDGVRVPRTGLDHYIIFNPGIIKVVD